MHEIDTVRALAQNIGVNELHLSEPYSVEKFDSTVRLVKNMQYEKIPFHYICESAKKNMDDMLLGIRNDPIDTCFSQKWFRQYSDEGFETLGDEQDTCQWLYKNISMDSLGRIMPCCQPPFLTEDLVFDQIDRNADVYNSKKYKLVRRFFLNRDTIYDCPDLLKNTQLPSCIICPFSKKALIDTENVKNYLYSISKFKNVLSEKSISLLTDW